MYLFKKALLSLVLATLPLTLAACSGVKQSMIAERPRDENFRMELKKEMSAFNVTVGASADDLSKILNKSIRKEIYKGSTRTRGLGADVERNGPITVSAADNFLYFTIPIAVTLNYGMFTTQAIPVTLKFKGNATITPDWKLNTEIYYVGLSDLLTGDLRIGLLSINPRSIVEGITQPVQKVLSDLISKKINEIIPLKPQVAKVWDAAQKPVLLDKNYNAWLIITPREVMLSSLSAQNNRVSLSVGINSFAEMVVGPEPATRPPVPLPNLKLVRTFDKNFRIALNADLFYKDILSIVSPLLLNKEFNSDGKSIILKKFELYGNGDKIIVKIETRGSLEGVFYLAGKPRFNPDTNIFSVEDVDFDMQTESLLLQSADWFLHGTIRNRIQEKLNLDLTQRLEQTRQIAQKAIAQVQLADHVLLKGVIKTLKFRDVLVQKDKISIQVYSEGETGIIFQ